MRLVLIILQSLCLIVILVGILISVPLTVFVIAWQSAEDNAKKIGEFIDAKL